MLAPLRRGLRRAFPSGPPLDRRARAALIAVVALGAVARLVWVLVVAEPPGDDPGEVPRDPGFYLLLGENLANGEGYSYPNPDDFSPEPTAYYPPGYPLVLGATFWLTDLLPFELSTFGVAVGLNVILSVATIALVFELGRRMLGPAVGLAAAGVTALWPNLVVHSGVVLTETLFLFLVVLMLLVALASPEVARAPGRWRMATVGLLLGAVVLVRPTSVVVAPLFLLLWWPAGVVAAVRRLALVGVAALAVVLPWTVRNAVQLDSFVLISANMGDNVCVGHNPGASGAFGIAPYCFDGLEGPEAGETQGEYQVRRQGETLDRALQHIREEPADVVTLMPAKARYTLSADADGLDAATDYGVHELFSESRMDTLERISTAYYALVTVVGLAGVVLLLRRDDSARRGLFLVVVAVAQLVPPLLTFGDARFKMPIYPAVAICAGLAVVTALGRVRGRQTSDPGEQGRPRSESESSAAEPLVRHGG